MCCVLHMVISFLHLLSIDFSGFHKLLIPALAVFIHTDSLLCPQPHTNWQQPAIRGRARAADLHFKEAEQRSPAWRHGQHCHCGTQVIILHTAVVSLHTLNMLSLNCSSSGVEWLYRYIFKNFKNKTRTGCTSFNLFKIFSNPHRVHKLLA